MQEQLTALYLNGTVRPWISLHGREDPIWVTTILDYFESTEQDTVQYEAFQKHKILYFTKLEFEASIQTHRMLS